MCGRWREVNTELAFKDAWLVLVYQVNPRRYLYRLIAMIGRRVGDFQFIDGGKAVIAPFKVAPENNLIQ